MKDGASYSQNTLYELKTRATEAEARVTTLERDNKSLTVRLDREKRTRARFERDLNELKGHMMYVHDHCGVEAWRRRISTWLKAL